jgi:hypothetical protein
MGALAYARARSSGLRSKVGLMRRAMVSSGEARREGAGMPESGLPIWVYKEQLAVGEAAEPRCVQITQSSGGQ